MIPGYHENRDIEVYDQFRKSFIEQPDGFEGGDSTVIDVPGNQNCIDLVFPGIPNKLIK
jgi:hypothetical protein